MTKKPTYEELEQRVKELEKEAVEHKRAKQKLQTIIDVLPVIIFQKDRDGKTIRTNQAFDSMIGLSKEEIIGKTTDELFPEHGKDMMKDDQEVMESGKPKMDIIENYDSYEGTRWARTGKAPLKDKEGNVVGLIGYAADITEQKHTEKALWASETEKKSILNAMPDIVLFQDTNLSIRWGNEAAGRSVDKTQEELVGCFCYELWHGRSEPCEGCPVLIALKTGSSAKSIMTIPDERWWEIAGEPVFDMDGKVVGAIEIARDITEKKNLEAQLQRAEKMEAIGTLAGGVAHDLNNVLSAQVSYPDLILMDLPEDSPLRKPILTIQQSGQKAAAIVQDLLTLARRGVVATEVVNLNQVINSYLSSPEHEKIKEFHPDAKIETDLETYLLNIMGSSVHLSKSIMNLVSNAAEAMPDRGNIFISTQSKYVDKTIRGYDDIKEGDYVILTVSDTGIGISSEDMERIFEPFYTKKVMGRSGTGLGMSVVWGTVKDHKGYIDVQSAEGKGTTFTLYFPVTRKEISGKEKALPIEDYMGKGESILVVDDVEEQREIASIILKKSGYSVTLVSSGEEAVDYMKDNSADLLILDMIMDPGIDGLETYKRTGLCT